VPDPKPAGPPKPTLRVLLLGPVAGRDPLSGDTSYVDALATAPPPGIEYVRYPDALADGSLVIRGRRKKHGARTFTDRWLLVLRSIEGAARRTVMFREPTWFVSTAPGAFDLIHAHLFPVRQLGPAHLPLVSSAGYPLPVLYRAREGWSERRAKVATWLERVWTRSLAVHDPWCHCAADGVMTVYSEHFRGLLIAGGTPPDRVLIAGTALPALPLPSDTSEAVRIGFIGRDFVRKGGPIAVEAFARLGRLHPDWQFVVAGSPSSDGSEVAPGIQILGPVPREEVLDTLLPSLDVLVLPTSLDCGAPYTVLEALQRGVSVVLGRSPWLDERLAGPAIERASDATELVAAVESLLARGSREERAGAATELWRSTFDMPSLHRALLPAYGAALALQLRSARAAS